MTSAEPASTGANAVQDECDKRAVKIMGTERRRRESSSSKERSTTSFYGLNASICDCSTSSKDDDGTEQMREGFVGGRVVSLNVTELFFYAFEATFRIIGGGECSRVVVSWTKLIKSEI